MVSHLPRRLLFPSAVCVVGVPILIELIIDEGGAEIVIYDHTM